MPRAELVGLTIFPARASVEVTAVDGGPSGNVDAGTIVIVPNGENGLFLKVTNPEPTTGGNRQEFTRVTQQDVDAAMAALNASLQAAFDEAMADPSLTAGGATVFPSTGKLGPTTPTVAAGDPRRPGGRDLRARACPRPGRSSPPTRRRSRRSPRPSSGRRSSPTTSSCRARSGSTSATPVVVGQTVSVPVTASAQQVAVLDPERLEKLILGKSIAEAHAILEPFGTVEISVSPDWSGSIPSFESRVDLTVSEAVQIETPAPSGSAAP